MTSQEPPEAHKGKTLAGRYRIDRFLARGGMGEVYHAFDLDLEIPVALKTIRREIASHPLSLRALKREVLMARSITHPNVCRIYDLGRDEATGVSFLTMEYLPGETLAARIARDGPMASEVAATIVRQFADALDAAHRAGIVHRDFKSANVMLSTTEVGERVVIMDFGLAVAAKSNSSGASARETGVGAGVAAMAAAASAGSAIDAATAETLPESDPTPARDLVGTPAYMSPEQVTGGIIGPATDLYALGVVLFEMMTGRLPFPGSSAAEVAGARLIHDPPAPSSLAKVDAEWERAILKLLSREPHDRFTSAVEVVLALEGRYTGEAQTKHTLPAESDAFVGRSEQLLRLAELLEPDPSQPSRSRLVTLLGVGGLGKTRLAQRYGWESLPRWPGGVWFCDLVEARNVDGIVAGVAAGLGVPLGKGDPVEQLGHAIAGRGAALLILDNFEQVAEQAEQTLGRWLSRCPETSFLVTSQERLGLQSEAVLALEPLDPTSHGVELFELCAQATRPGFVVDEANREVVVEIVTRLDGLPLAIELAAARLRMLTLEQIRQRLDARFQLLAGGKRGRHATLQATLDWSWELLRPWEQSALAQASVFAGGFTLEAAEAVVDLSDHLEAPLVLDVIQSLVDKSWVRTKVVRGAPRMNMYTTVHEYAANRLTSSSPTTRGGAEERHRRHFATMGSRDAVARLRRHGGLERRAALALDLENLVAACRQSIAVGDETSAAYVFVAAATVLAIRGPVAFAVELGADVLTLVRSEPLRSNVLRVLGDCERILGRPAQAKAHLEDALALDRATGDRRSEGHSLSSVGSIASSSGRLDEAHALFHEALAIHREVGNRVNEGITLGNLAVVETNRGRLDEAREHYEQALRIHLEVGDRVSEANARANLGSLYFNLGRLDEAREFIEQALRINREIGNRRAEGVALTQLGNVACIRSEITKAAAHYEQALAIHREVGNRQEEATTLIGLGVSLSSDGRQAEAGACYEQAQVIYREIGDRLSEGNVLTHLGDHDRALGRLDDSCARFEQALEIHREVGNRQSEGATLASLGDVRRRQGATEEARAHLEQGLTISRVIGNQLCAGQTSGYLGVLHRELGDLSAARACFDEGIAAFREVGYQVGLATILGERGALAIQLHDFEAAREDLVELEEIDRSLGLGSDSDIGLALATLRAAISAR